ncbi:integral membrane protein MviN [Denitrovibrio acetiphilus DSM 12809]|uniref:Probable lipid II flippase MurJ n=1 Tax=Denitrovibrio acetiphilus (strain DSM 12809 / NBRC 114555 / N2460) TaxID=522772 RepID=D4H869_DENA2|nr:murein biosynthesis integral membrane protein MurJ [Denitrovibrio acetiphilus]ADD68218.1 integral membrane protein MviN [Denitrovibrio acetiphilus DSM 12809]
MSGFIYKVLKSGLGIFTSRIFGLIRDVAVAGFFGASGVTDAFFVAFAIPNLFRAFFAEGALSSAFVPFLSDNMSLKSRQAADNYLTSLIVAVSGMICAILFFTTLFPTQIVTMFMPGYADDADLIAKAASMVVVLMPYLLFVTICALLSGYLNLKGSYYIPSSSTAILNIAMIVGAWIGFQRGIDIMYLCYGVFAGGVLQLVYVMSYAFYKGFRPNLKGGYSRDVRKTFYLVIPSLAGVGINQLNFMVGRILASFLTVGSISYLYYANRLFQFPLGMFAVAVGTVTLTEISRANTEGDLSRRNNLINKAVNAIFIIMLPASTGLIVLAYPIIEIVYARMNFSLSDVGATASALQMYTVGLMFYSMLNVFSRVFHSEKDMKTPVKGAFIALIANIVFNLILIKPMGHAGIALASGIAAGMNCLYLYVKMRDYKYDFMKNIKLLIKIAIACFFMGGATYSLFLAGLNIIPVILIGCIVYFVSLRLTGIHIRSALR